MKTLAALALFFFFPLLTFAGFGISPPQINEQNAVPGVSFDRTIYLVQGNPTAPVSVEVSVDGDQVKEWFSFPNGNTFTIPAGVQQYPLVVTTRIPPDTALGIYRGFIRVNTIPEKAEGAGEVAISIGARIDVSITVGDDVIELYRIGDIKIPSIVEGKALRAEFKVINEGNTSAGPAGISFELFDKFNTVRLAFAQASITDRVPAFKEEVLSVEFPIDVVLAPGEYWGQVKVFDQNNTLLKESRAVFEVKESTLFGALFSFTTVWIVGLVFAAFALSLAMFVFLRKRRKRTVH